MAAEDTRMKAGLTTAEDELNLIKNQVQQTLLDIREHILDATNPFNAIDDALTDEDDIEFDDDILGGGAGGPGGAGGDSGDSGSDDSSSSDSDSEGSDGFDEFEDEDEDSGEELVDDLIDEPGEEIIEEIPDDGYEEQIIDDGAGSPMSSPLSDPEEIFEEEEIPEEIEEAFELDEEPGEDDESGEESGASGLTGDGLVAALTANFDVLTMAGLVRWVAVTNERIGANRTEIMLDAFEAGGRIAPSTRAVLHHLMALIEEDPSEPIPVREIVSAMVRMEGVMETAAGGTDSTRLLTMLMDVEDDPLDRMIA